MSALLGRRVQVSYARSLGLVTDPRGARDLTQPVRVPVVGVLRELARGRPLLVDVGGRSWSTSPVRSVDDGRGVAEVVTVRGSVYMVRLVPEAAPPPKRRRWALWAGDGADEPQEDGEAS